MADSRSKTPPRGLKSPGRKVWRQVLSAYKLRPDELVLLENACKTVDIIADLEAAMAGEPLVTKGSMGQTREHPLLSEARQQRAYLGRTLAQLSLPDLDAPVKVNPHRQGGLSRWAQHHGPTSRDWKYGS
jgi:hypothetical protein